MRDRVNRIPFVGPLVTHLYRRLRGPIDFTRSEDYWEARYARGGDSGAGSMGRLAAFKAEIVNGFVRDRAIHSVVEHGCGDGHQLLLARYPTYIGFDVSTTAIRNCRALFAGDASKSFKLAGEYAGEQADLSLSLDVVFHLVEQEVFEEYMLRLFESSRRYVIVYSSNSDDNAGYEGTHVRHRKFTDWVNVHLPQWRLTERIPNRYPLSQNGRRGSFAEFYVYQIAREQTHPSH